MSVSSIVIIGAGQAGAQTAFSLRQNGYTETITMVGDETSPPYQRPPLSKAYLKSEISQERLFLKTPEWYKNNNVNLRLGTHASRIDKSASKVFLDNNETLSYDRLVIATGARTRSVDLPGISTNGVFDIRTLEDVDRIQPSLQKNAKLIILGAGYIGLETAAVATQLGLNVTIIERTDRILSRVTSNTISQYYTKLHRKHGVNIKTGTSIDSFLTSDNQLVGAKLTDGSILTADLAVIGIGIVPNTEIAQTANIKIKNGIVVDDDTKTSDPNIFAVGDCTERPLPLYGKTGRLESVHNAIEQGKLAAAAISGHQKPKLDCPWFWSDQYDVKLQIAGLSQEADSQIIRGNQDSNSFALFYFKDKKLIAVDAINRPQEFLIGKKLISAAAPVQHLPFGNEKISPKQLADTPLQDRSQQ